jgi:simple sugar transport system permease protein
MLDHATLILSAGVRLAVPLLFAATGEYVAERAGTLNVSVEGMMLAGAYGGVVGASYTGSTVVGFGVGMLAGLLVAFAQANLSNRLSTNPFVVALALNTLVLGLTSFLAEAYPPDRAPRVGILTIPIISKIPLVGEPLFSQRWPAFLVYAMIPGAWWLMQKSRFGLQVRAVGENPSAADVASIPVLGRQRQAIYICGVMSGLGGAYLAVAEVGTFNQNMTVGRGFIAIAAVIFGGWTLRGTVAGCLLFGVADALRLALPAIGFEITAQALIMAPYVAALGAMLILARHHRQPAALAATFERGIT